MAEAASLVGLCETSRYATWFHSGWVLSISNSISRMFLHKQQMSEKLFGLTGYIKPPGCCPPSPITLPQPSLLLIHSTCPPISRHINGLSIFFQPISLSHFLQFLSISFDFQPRNISSIQVLPFVTLAHQQRLGSGSWNYHST